jgi:hypothetical protein
MVTRFGLNKRLILKIQQNVVAEKMLLFWQMLFWQDFQLSEMWPAIFIVSIQPIVPAGRKHRTNRDVHEILLLFLGERLWTFSELLYPNQQQNAIHIGFNSPGFLQFDPQFQPTHRQIFFHMLHGAKVSNMPFRFIFVRKRLTFIIHAFHRYNPSTT